MIGKDREPRSKKADAVFLMVRIARRKAKE
jgi:hypothetical protein